MNKNFASFELFHWSVEDIRKQIVEWLNLTAPGEVNAAEALPMEIFWQLYRDIQPAGEDWDRLRTIYSTFMENNSDGVDKRILAFHEKMYQLEHEGGYSHRIGNNFLWMKYVNSDFSRPPIPPRSLPADAVFNVIDYNNLYNRVTDCLLFPVSEAERIKARQLVDDYIADERERP